MNLENLDHLPSSPKSGRYLIFTKQAVIFSHGNFSFLWTGTGSPFRPFSELFRNTNPYQSRLLPTFRYFEYRYRLPNGDVVCVKYNTYIIYCFIDIYYWWGSKILPDGGSNLKYPVGKLFFREFIWIRNTCRKIGVHVYVLVSWYSIALIMVTKFLASSDTLCVWLRLLPIVHEI